MFILQRGNQRLYGLRISELAKLLGRSLTYKTGFVLECCDILADANRRCRLGRRNIRLLRGVGLARQVCCDFCIVRRPLDRDSEFRAFRHLAPAAERKMQVTPIKTGSAENPQERG